MGLRICLGGHSKGIRKDESLRRRAGSTSIRENTKAKADRTTGFRIKTIRKEVKSDA